MKKTFLFLLFIPLLSISQITERVFIEGKVNVPLQDDAANIDVYNKNTEKGTVTDEIGKFQIFAAVGDELHFSAVQYEEFTVIVNQKMVDDKKMVVMLREAQNPLDEVVVNPYDLSGNIIADVQRVKTTDPINLSQETKSAIATMEGEYTKDYLSTEQKPVVSDQFIEYGLDVANIFRTIFKKVGKRDDHKLPKDLDVTVRKMYDDDFFNEYLDIDEGQINEFIFFVQDEGLNKDLLAKKNQLDFIQFLIVKSNEFKSRME